MSCLLICRVFLIVQGSSLAWDLSPMGKWNLKRFQWPNRLRLRVFIHITSVHIHSREEHYVTWRSSRKLVLRSMFGYSAEIPQDTKSHAENQGPRGKGRSCWQHWVEFERVIRSWSFSLCKEGETDDCHYFLPLAAPHILWKWSLNLQYLFQVVW